MALMQVTCCQFQIAWEDKPTNFAKVYAALRAASIAPNGLIVLPEMFATGFSMNVATIAEEANGETSQFLQSIAREFKSHVIGGLVQKGRAGRGHNVAAAFDPAGNEVARYIKRQPFSLGGECEAYDAGTAISTFACGEFVAAPFVCYDLRFPELFRLATIAGANLLVIIANWPFKRIDHWTTLLRARAIENQAYVIGVNRPGTDPTYVYSGRSMVIDPHGNVLGELHDTEGLVQANISSAVVQQWRQDFPALRDMRPYLFKTV